ncbi:hypothetical protein ACFLS9_01240 [Bacteroidota bacterium]
MAVYRPIHTTFWQDDFMLKCTPEQKFFYIYLLTNSKTTQLGIYQISKKVIELETGYNPETIDKLIIWFEKAKKIMCSKETNEIFLLNWLKHNPVNNTNIYKCVANELEKVKNKRLLKSLDHLLSPYVGVWKGKLNRNDIENMDYAGAIKGLIRGLHTPMKKKEKEKEKEKYTLNSSEFRLASLLYELIRQRNSKHRKPNLQLWAKHIDYLIRIDKRIPADIEKVIRWCQQDPFWKNNILSTSKLRDKFDQLYLKMNSDKQTNINNENKEYYT